MIHGNANSIDKPNTALQKNHVPKAFAVKSSHCDHPQTITREGFSCGQILAIILLAIIFFPLAIIPCLMPSCYETKVKCVSCGKTLG